MYVHTLNTYTYVCFTCLYNCDDIENSAPNCVHSSSMTNSNEIPYT